MRAMAAVLAIAVLGACATTMDAPPGERYFNDALFAPPAQRIDAGDVFALSDEMRGYLEREIETRPKDKTRQLALVDALYGTGDLRLEYDSAMTRTAAQAFAARSGNCLSLVIMTAAFAKALDLPVTYQKVYVDDTWARSGNIYLAIGHVNLTLGRRATDAGGFGHRVGKKPRESEGMTIDFLPPEDMRRVHSRAIGEDIVLAMYLNNRAVEALARGGVNEAYWWAREAIVQSPGFLVAYNTLGAVYQKHGSYAEAEAVLRHVLASEPANTQAMGNLVVVLAESGQAAQSQALAAKLAHIEPEPPFAHFSRGLAAIRAGDMRAAKEMFKRELQRQPDYHESHYWLAVAHMSLGEHEDARRHLAIAIQNSTTRGDHERYAQKLDRLRKTP